MPIQAAESQDRTGDITMSKEWFAEVALIRPERDKLDWLPLKLGQGPWTMDKALEIIEKSRVEDTTRKHNAPGFKWSYRLRNTKGKTLAL